MTHTLVSYVLCPYAQRISISLMEKGVDFTRMNIDLADKPDWFVALSPLGKVPLLLIEGKIQQTVLFESSAILEYLEETQPNILHNSDPLVRAKDRAWIEFGSSVLNDISGFYSAKSEDQFISKTQSISQKFLRLENALGDGPWFSGNRFGLVDVVFGSIFRYFDVFDEIDDFKILQNRNKLAAWRKRLANRTSIQQAVPSDYPELLLRFLLKKQSYLSELILSRQFI